MSQTTHNTAPAVAVPGQIVDTSAVRDVQTAIIDSTNGVVPYGAFVRILTAPAAGQRPVVELPNATGEITGDSGFGFVVYDPSREQPGAGFATGTVVSILTRGRIWVTSEQAVSAVAAPAFVRFSTGTLGAVRIDADTANAVALPGAHLMTTCGAAGLTELEYFKQD
jgi:hypothetical protein